MYREWQERKIRDTGGTIEDMKFVRSVWADAQCLAKSFPVCFQFNHCKSAS